jgi:hypothetical protein
MTDQTSATYWSTTVRMGSHRIYAWERVERRGAIHLKFSWT